MASPSLVAHTIVNKYQHHLPLYRQEKIWQDLGIELPRNTVCGWIMAAFDVCKPLKEVLWQEIIKSGYIQADETPLQVMNEPGRSNTQKSYMWVYQSLPVKPLILFDYRQTRQALWPQEMLADFKGYLQTDGYKGYDWVADKSNIIHLGCMVHARRPFAEMVKLAKKTGKSHQAIALFEKLYAIEKYARDNKLTIEQRYELRLKKQKPLLDELFAFVDKSLVYAAPQSKLQNALLYIKQRQSQLSNYLLNGMLEIDNNLTENQIRPFALGRKNWLFSASPNGAHASAFFYSLIASACANNLNPFDYLHHLFLNIRSCKSHDDYINLLPTNIILTNR